MRMWVIETVVFDDFGMPQESTPLNLSFQEGSVREQVELENLTSNQDPNVETIARAI